VTKVADCAERMIQFRQRYPAAEFDLKPNLFTARVPGRDEPWVRLSWGEHPGHAAGGTGGARGAP
jgi:hypothetical protein